MCLVDWDAPACRRQAKARPYNWKEATMETASERAALYERQARVLERVAKRYAKDSVEVATLKEAGFALCFSLTQRYEEFIKYLAEMNRPMTEKDEKHLKELGL